MATARLNNALGLCQKAGGIKSGAQAVEAELKAGRAYLLVADEALSPSAKKKLEAQCLAAELQLVFSAEVGQAIGKTGRMVLAVTDKRFLPMIMNALE